jgi:hypothetical protein
MKTNQKCRSVRLIALAYLLFFTLSSLGQNHISDIKRNGKSVLRMEITITEPNGRPSKIEIKKNSPIRSGSILEVPSGITLYLTSINGNIGEITGPNSLKFSASDVREEYRYIDGKESSNILINVYKQLTGGVIGNGPTNRVQARSRLTKFILNFNGENLEFELIKGKVDVNRRQEIQIRDEIVIDNNKTRSVFVRETNQLTLKESKFNIEPNNLNIQSLNSEMEINKFFNRQFREQKKIITKAGANSKSAYKDMNSGEQFDRGMESLEKAIENGEITSELLIQTSLLLADAYLRKDELKKSLSWLDVGLHHSKILYDANKIIFDHFSNIDKNKIAKAFGNDLLIANEFYAWGFDIKLKINGCLENANENPSTYRKDANNLKLELANY